MIFVKVNAGLLTLLDAATKVMQEEMIKNVSNIQKYQPFSLLHDQFVLNCMNLFLANPSSVILSSWKKFIFRVKVLVMVIAVVH